MTHEEARLLIGAAPTEVGPALAEHLAQCPDCALFQEQMRRMDQDLSRLFAAPLPARAAAAVVALPIMARAKPKPAARSFPGLLALAASLVASVGLGILFWTLRPQPSLAAGVLGHIALESGSWSAVTPMTAAATDAVLTGAGVSLDSSDTTVTYARTCLFNGHWVPHLVVRTAAGPVTVMVLREEHIPARQTFRQNGYSGILVPSPSGGTLAVIVQGVPDMNEVARALGPHLHWTR
jgi:anti-sigma factor RsiW